MAAGWYRWDGADLILHVRVQPRAGRDEWLEPRADRMQLRIAAPPVDGKANTHLREFLAALFGVAKSQIILLAGESGRDKRLRVAAPRHLPPGIEPAPRPELAPKGSAGSRN